MTAVLGFAVFTVFVLLPKWVDTPLQSTGFEMTPQAPAPRPAGETSVPSTDPIAQGDARSQAQAALDRVMQMQSDLEERGARSWAGTAFATAAQRTAEGDDHLAAGEYAAAVAAYEQAALGFKALNAEARERFQAAMNGGDRALEAGDSAAAAQDYGAAVTLQPDNSAARQGLRRAEVLDRVLTLIDEGRAAERRGDLERAGDKYRQAATLDPQSRSARAALAAISTKIEHDAFATAMTEGLIALDRQDYAVARESFQRAARLRPGSEEAAEGIARAEDGLRLQLIQSHRTRAEALERAERWSEAVVEYQKVVAIDPAVAFAQRGLREATARADLADRLQFHIDNPGRLGAATVREEASELLTEARGASPSGPVLESQIERLEVLVHRATIPVAVELESDGLTEIVIYRVGRLGTFTRHSLELLPGTYIVVGTRSGFRDVRIELVVKPDQPPGPLMIRCEEQI